MTFIVDRYATEVIYPIRIKTDLGDPITGLTFDTPGLSIGFQIVGSSVPVMIPLVAGTEGVWIEGGFVERLIGDGWYELAVPAYALSPGATTDFMVDTAGNNTRYGSISATGSRSAIKLTASFEISDATVPVTIDLPNHYRGDTWPGIAETAVVDSDDDPVDLAGASIRMHVRRCHSDPVALLEFSTANGGIGVSDASGGLFAVNKAVINLNPGEYVFDIEIAFSSGDIRSVLRGAWQIVGDITRQ